MEIKFKNHFSPSSFKKFISCPMQWVQSIMNPQKMSGKLIMNIGTCVHKILEDSNSDPTLLINNDENKRRIEAVYDSYVEPESEYKTTEKTRLSKRRCIELQQTLCHFVYENDILCEDGRAEVAFIRKINVDTMMVNAVLDGCSDMEAKKQALLRKNNELIIKGYADYATQDHVFDWKIGNAQVTEQAHFLNVMQCGLYAVCLDTRYTSLVYAYHVAHQGGVSDMRTTTWTKRRIKVLQSQLKRALALINGEVEPEMNPTFIWCPYCDFKDKCPMSEIM